MTDFELPTVKYVLKCSECGDRKEDVELRKQYIDCKKVYISLCDKCHMCHMCIDHTTTTMVK